MFRSTLLRTHAARRSGSLSTRHIYRPVIFRMASTLPRTPIFEALAKHDPSHTAVVHSISQRRYTYGQLLQDVSSSRENLVESLNSKSFEGERIAFLIENNYDYVVNLLAILSNNAVAVPLAPTFPSNELRYIINHCQASLLLASKKYHEKAAEVVREGLDVPTQIFAVDKLLPNTFLENTVRLEESSESRGGMMLYTSGTTNRPKGVLLSQQTLTAQSLSLLEAWKYSPSDYLLHVLPLHHIHGTVNAILAPLFAGSTIEFMFPFNVDAVWRRLAAPYLASGQQGQEKITFFTAVPTIYGRLLQSHPNLDPGLQEATRTAVSPNNLRLNISGSAALPTPIKSAWALLSHGNVLLERFGMTEVGMALSCGLDFKDRVDGSVGWPLPFVEARLVDTDNHEIIPVGQELDEKGSERHGEIQLRGPTVFQGYWNNPEATASEFVEGEDGKGRWFKTGDVAVRREAPDAGQSNAAWSRGPIYFIQGRKSADIIKSGGEKVSALEVEREMLSLPEISECAVVGVPSNSWGQKVASVVVLTDRGLTGGRNGKAWGPMDLRRALKERLANYKIPQEMKVLESIPRNAMGKINKKQLVLDVFEGGSPPPE